jgi:hypothetical protein
MSDLGKPYRTTTCGELELIPLPRNGLTSQCLYYAILYVLCMTQMCYTYRRLRTYSYSQQPQYVRSTSLLEHNILKPRKQLRSTSTNSILRCLHPAMVRRYEPSPVLTARMSQAGLTYLPRIYSTSTMFKARTLTITGYNRSRIQAARLRGRRRSNQRLPRSRVPQKRRPLWRRQPQSVRGLRPALKRQHSNQHRHQRRAQTQPCSRRRST